MAITLLHLDERSEAQGLTPCVIVQDDSGIRVILGSEALAACGGSVERLEQVLLEALGDHPQVLLEALGDHPQVTSASSSDQPP